MKQWRVGTLSMGLLLVAIGAIMIYARIYGLSSVGQIISWWPVIVIMLGIEVLAYSLLAGRQQIQVKIDGFSIFMIIMVLLISLGAYGLTNLAQGISNIDFAHNIGIDSRYNSTFERSITVSRNEADKFTVENVFGSVQIEKSESDSIEIEADITIRNNDEEYAKTASESLIEVTEGGIVKVKTNREQYMGDKSKIQGISVDYIIKVPAGMDVDVDNGFELVKVEDITGSVEIKNPHGQVIAKSIGGDLYINNSFASVDIEGVGGKAEVYSQHSGVNASNIGGSLVIEDSFSDVRVKEIKGDTRISDNNGDIEVNGIGGKLVIDSKFSGVDIKGVKGSLEVEGNNGNMILNSIDGDVNAVNRFGDIKLTGANKLISLSTNNGEIEFMSDKLLEKDLHIENQFGNIEIRVPEAQQGHYRASTTHGKISSDFNLSIREETTEESVDQVVGTETVNLDLRTKNGDIRIMAD